MTRIIIFLGGLRRHGQRRDEEAQRAAEYRLKELSPGTSFNLELLGDWSFSEIFQSLNLIQDLVEKIRRQKSKASQFKEKFGLGSGSAVGGGSGSSAAAAAAKLAKSKSVSIPSPTIEELPDLTRGGPISDY